MVINYSDVTMYCEEGIKQAQLKKFLAVQQSALKKKSRVQRLQLGESKSKFFFSAMNERNAKNSIDILYSAAGVELTTEAEIKREIGGVNKSLIGTAASSLQGIDIKVNS